MERNITYSVENTAENTAEILQETCGFAMPKDQYMTQVHSQKCQSPQGVDVNTVFKWSKASWQAGGHFQSAPLCMRCVSGMQMSK